MHQGELIPILLIEDDDAIAGLVRAGLGLEGFEVHTASTAAAGLEAVADHDPVVVLVDLGLPDRNGLGVIDELRRNRDQRGVICLTARADESDRVLGFEVGADDYVTKPFSPKELAGRVRALARRVSASRPPSGGSFDLGALAVDGARREIRVEGAAIETTPIEFDLIADLASHAGTTRSRADLLVSVWGHQAVGSTRTVDTHVSQLRTKLGTAVTITSVRGVGYRLDP